MSIRKRTWYTASQRRILEAKAKELAHAENKLDQWRCFLDLAASETGIEKSSAWVTDYTDQHGGRHIQTFAKKTDAQAYRDTVGIQVRAGIHTPPSKSITVERASELWIAGAEARLERATFESYRQHLRHHIIPFIGSIKLSQLTVPVVRDFIDRLRGAKRSAAMIKRVVGDLGSILADAQERGLVAQNVVCSLAQRRKENDRRQKEKLTVGVDIPAPTEIKAIIAHFKGRWRPLLLTAIFTGLRASELRGLCWLDVDLKRGELHVRQRADRYNKIGPPKSAAGRRTVPLPPLLLNTLREWKLICPKGEAGLVFPNTAGGIENLSNILQRGYAPAQIAAGVTEPVKDASGKPKVDKDGNPVLSPKYTGLHCLRHFYASWCINPKEEGGRGLSPKIVQAYLGHSSIAMTMDRYGHLFPRGDDSAELAAAETALLA